MSKNLFGIKQIILVLSLLCFGVFFFQTFSSEDFSFDNLTPFSLKQTEENEFQKIEETVKIANWNLQIFGQKKAQNKELMEIYKNKIEDYDIIFVQEIRDITGESFEDLCKSLEKYNCKISSRAGRSNSKEQYGIIYAKEIEILEFEDFNPDKEDRWERPPIKVVFKIQDYAITAYNIHTKPSDVPNEISFLEAIIDANGNIIVLGDLNADCDYYDREKETHFLSWNWLIKSWEDTTQGNSDCAYDRIIINKDAEEELKESGIDKEGITKEISDHYLVWAEFSLQEV